MSSILLLLLLSIFLLLPPSTAYLPRHPLAFTLQSRHNTHLHLHTASNPPQEPPEFASTSSPFDPTSTKQRYFPSPYQHDRQSFRGQYRVSHTSYADFNPSMNHHYQSEGGGGGDVGGSFEGYFDDFYLKQDDMKIVSVKAVLVGFRTSADEKERMRNANADSFYDD